MYYVIVHTYSEASRCPQCYDVDNLISITCTLVIHITMVVNVKGFKRDNVWRRREEEKRERRLQVRKRRESGERGRNVRERERESVVHVETRVRGCRHLQHHRPNQREVDEVGRICT